MKEKLPLFVLAAIGSAITLYAQREASAFRTLGELSFSARLGNTLVAYVRYIAHTLWPVRLSPLYPHTFAAPPLAQVAGAAALLAIITAVVIRWRNLRYLPVGWFLFLGTLVPVIGPRGWLRHQLQTEVGGMTGQLQEISKWCKFEGNAWSDPQGQGHSGWEELPYWLKGYGDLGYVLKDEAIIKDARKWIDAVLASQDAGRLVRPARPARPALDGKPDLWPHMVMLNVLQSYYESTGDPRVLPFMTPLLPVADSACPKRPDGGLLAKTARRRQHRKRLLALQPHRASRGCWTWPRRSTAHGADWTDGHARLAQREHRAGIPRAGASITCRPASESTSTPAERNYQTVMGPYGQLPGGGFAGDENCRPGYIDPRQGFETCGIVEFMHSFEMLTKITGNPSGPTAARRSPSTRFPPR